MAYVTLGLTNQNEADTTANQSNMRPFQNAQFPQLAYRSPGQTMRHIESPSPRECAELPANRHVQTIR